MRVFLIILFSVFPLCVHAQQLVQPCVNVTTNGVTTCQPITTSNPLPVTTS